MKITYNVYEGENSGQVINEKRRLSQTRMRTIENQKFRRYRPKIGT